MSSSLKPVDGIILCATMRCGSTMVCEDFRNTGVLGKPEEYFIPWMRTREHIWPRSFKHIVERSRGDNGRFALKVMANQLPSINHGLSQIDEFSHLADDHFFQVFDQCDFVFLRRRNIVKQAISRYVSQVRRINHLKDGEEGYTPGNTTTDRTELEAAIPFDPERIYEHVTNIAIENRTWVNKFRKFELHPPTFWYEDIVAENTTSYLNDICGHFGLPEVEDVVAERTLQKMANKVNTALLDDFTSL